jgi:hypothetical protein
MVLTKVEELRSAFEADDYFTLGKIVRSLVWEDDVEARYQLAQWIESGELVLAQENGARKLRRRGYRTSAGDSRDGGSRLANVFPSSNGA